MIAAISDAPVSWITTLAFEKSSELWIQRSWRKKSECVNGLTHKRHSRRRVIHCCGIDASSCGMAEGSNPSYRSQQTAEFASEPLRNLWYIRPEIATNDGLPGVGKTCDDSKAAKENMRFKRRERREMLWSFVIVSYSGGRGGRGGIRANLLPFGPQQKPGLSPVKRMTPHILHACVIPRLFATVPQWRSGEEIGPIVQGDALEVYNL